MGIVVALQAILAVKDCQHVENILGLNVKSSRMEAKEPIASEDDASSEMSAAAERIRYLLAAAGREPCLNSFNDLGLMKIKILVNDQVIRSKNGNASAIESFIILGHNQYSSNDALARALLRRPGRRAPCIRCQVYGFTFYTCRVLRCHSNPDFDFVANWREVGGIEGLLAPFKAASSVPIAGCDPHLSHFQDPMAVDKNSILEDPTMELEKARKAVQTSTFLVGQADALASERFKLSTKFIQAAFPVDPDDGHYIWCTICGLSGDVLCCDGCSNVVHPKCIGLSTIPEDDWFCDACSIKRKSSDQTNPPSRSADHSSPIELPNSLGSHHVHSPSAKAKPVPLITDDEYDEQVELLAKLVDELDRRRYPNGKPQKNAQITVGTIFYKTFSKFGRFKGKVVSTPTESHPYCSVEYEDGDVEELELAELLSLLQESEDVVAEESRAKLQCHSSDSDGGHKGKRHCGRRDVAVASTLGDTVEVPRKRGRPRKYPLQSVAVDVSPNSLPRHTSTCQGASPEAPKILALKGKEKRGRPRKSTRDDENKKNCLSSTESSLPVPTIHQRIRPSFRSSRGNSSTAPSGQVAEGVKKRGRPRKAT